MDAWKQRLYAAYVSSGQAGAPAAQGEALDARSYPSFLRIIRRHLPRRRDISIADLGCGHGALVHCLRHLGYHNVEGVDASEEQVALAARLGIRGIRRGTMLEFLQERAAAFDVIFLMDVLEHLETGELLDLVGNAVRALKAGGVLLVHVPNGAGLFGMAVRYGDLTHESCFTGTSVRQLLAVCGVKDVEVHEDRPVVHGPVSLARWVAWMLLTVPARLLSAAESGVAQCVLSRNLLAVARKPL